MAGFRIPGPVCSSNSPLPDEGTLACYRTPLPGTLCTVHPASRQWHGYSRIGGFVARTLTLSPHAVALLQAIEDLRLKPYDDQTGKEVGAWVKGATIGYGHLIDNLEWDTFQAGITKPQADALFKADTGPFERAVGETIFVGVQQHEFDAMVILAFNIGADGFRNSSVAKLINDPKANRASLEVAWKSWNRSQGKVSPGLTHRRASEWRIYLSGIYARW